MKYLTALLLITCLVSGITAQIPNPGFENWIDDNTPSEWGTNNFTEFWYPISKSTISNSGSFALKAEIFDYNGTPIFPVSSATFPGVQNSRTITGYYQFSPTASSVTLTISSIYFNADGALLATGHMEIENSSSSYTQFRLDASNEASADSITLQVGIMSSDFANPGIGSYALFDDFSFDQTTDISSDDMIPTSYVLKQNYPNPFNPSTTIEYSIPTESVVKLKVYDLLGTEVVSLVNEKQSAGSYKTNFDAFNLPSGIYVARLTAGSFIKTQKMMLLK